MSEKVTVRFRISLAGYHSGEMEMSQEDYEWLDSLSNRELCKEISERMNWTGVETEVDWCDEFAATPL